MHQTLNKVKRQPTKWKILFNHISDRKFYPEYVKKSYINKKTTQLRNGRKI